MGPDSRCCALLPRPSIILAASQPPPRKLYHNLPLRLAQVNIPQFFEGCGWLAGFKTLWCLSTTRRRNSSITRPTKPAFHPTVHRSIDWSIDRVRLGQPLHLASPSGITTQFWKLLSNKADYILAGFDKTFSHHIAKLTAMFARLWIVFHQGMEWTLA